MEVKAEKQVIKPQTLQELELLQAALSDVDAEIAAKQYLMSKDILAQRQHIIAKIPGFWATVLTNAQADIGAVVQDGDGEVFQAALVGLEVERPYIPTGATAADVGLAKFGEPRSVRVRFHFKENNWFADSVLEKTFWYRYARDGSAGLVSDPVMINWKPGKDLTQGLDDAAYELWTAHKGDPVMMLEASLDKEARLKRNAAAKETPQYKKLAAMLEDENKITGAISFFNFFGFRGRWISEAESLEAKAAMLARRRRALAGEDVKEEGKVKEDDDEDDFDVEEAIETFTPGEDIAAALADDVFPSAINYFLADTIDSDDELELDDNEEDIYDKDVEMN